MHFVDNIAYTRYLDVEWTDRMKGVTVYFWIFGVKNAQNEEYSNWTFPTAEIWDGFFYSSDNTPVCRTENVKLGEDTVQVRDLNVHPNEIIKKEYEVNRTALGIPIEYGDI